MIERLELTEKRYKEIQDMLMQPDIITDIKKSKELSIELSSLEDTVVCYQRYKNVLNDLKEAQEMVKDEELKEYALEEITRLTEEKEQLEHELEILLIPKDKNDLKNVIMEIRGAAGGDEGNIFAGDLFRMYEKYCLKSGFQIEVLNAMEGTSGGYTLIEFMVKGKNVYSKLKYESGSHRVQRVPVTEANGRIQTSTATVLVMPEADDVEIEIKESDIKVDIYRSSGAGGQHINTTDSAVRITHLPSKIVVTCQNQRSQIQNREEAMRMLKNKLKLIEIEKRNQELQSVKGESMNIEFGSQIRSYVMHPYSLVKDHRTNCETSNVLKVLDGDLDSFIESYLKQNINL